MHKSNYTTLARCLSDVYSVEETYARTSYEASSYDGASNGGENFAGHISSDFMLLFDLLNLR